MYDQFLTDLCKWPFNRGETLAIAIFALGLLIFHLAIPPETDSGTDDETEEK